MSILADVPIVTLVASGVVLVASTLALSRSLPVLRWPPWRRRARRRRRDRLTVTGRVPELPPGPIPPIPATPVHLAIPPPRQDGPPPDVRRRARLVEAEATIERLLDTDPEHLARMIMQWIRDEAEDGSR